MRTDASCVRQMGYLAIFFCVFSSVLRFCPSETQGDAKGGFCVLLASFDFCVGILLVNLVDLVLVPKGLLTTCLYTKIHCNHTPHAVVALRRHPLPSRAAPSRRRRIYTYPSTCSTIPPRRCISPSSASAESNNPKRPQHGRLYWNGRILGGSPWRSPAARGDLTISKGGRRQRKVLGCAQTGVRCTMMR